MNMTSRFRGWLSMLKEHGATADRQNTSSAKLRQRLIELVAFALLLPLAGMALFASDPTGSQSGFPWIIAPPLLFAARYGSVWGVACGAVTAIFINLPIDVYASLASENLVLGVGLCVLCLFVGEATAALEKNNAKAQAENTYLRHRLDMFSTDYHVLKVSHGQLEEFMSGQRLSLREALQRLQPLLDEGPEGIRAGQDLMAVFAQFCSVQIAGLYGVDADGRVQSKAIATHGDMFELPVFDSLLNRALELKQVVSIKRDMLAGNHQPHNLLAVVPLVDVNKKLHGVLAIKDMHFMAFQQQNLNLLALLGSYLGNLLTRCRGVEQTPIARFVADLHMVVQFAREAHVESLLLSMQFEPSEQGHSVSRFIGESIRSLDSAVVLESSNEHHTIGLILPLMSEQSAQAFRARMDRAVFQQFNVQLDDVMRDIQIKFVGARDDLERCKTFFAVHARADALDLSPPLQGAQGAA